MYFEVYALSNTSAAATEVHTGKSTSPTRILSAGGTLTGSSNKNVSAKRGVTGVVADEDPMREG